MEEKFGHEHRLFPKGKSPISPCAGTALSLTAFSAEPNQARASCDVWRGPLATSRRKIDVFGPLVNGGGKAKPRRDERRGEKHHGETETHVSRLEQVFDAFDAKPQGKTCDAIMGIIEEGQEIMAEYKGSPALDAGLLAAAQAVEHYEISRYGTLRTWAEELGLSDVAELLEATLHEEKATDETLTKIAESVVNQEAQSRAA